MKFFSSVNRRRGSILRLYTIEPPLDECVSAEPPDVGANRNAAIGQHGRGSPRSNEEDGKIQMSRNEKLLTLIRKAETNGFELQAWFETNIAPEWPGVEEAVGVLATQGRLSALVFSHDFARAFWKRGEQMHFVVPAASYSRMNGRGEVVTVQRKPFTRRTLKPDVWQYHLRQMVVSEDPVTYLDRFLHAEPVISAELGEDADLPSAC
jgi:hypothetical protein